MILLEQVGVVLWKRLWIQTIRRHYIAAVAEIVVAMVSFLKIAELRPLASQLGNFTTAKIFDATYAFPSEWPNAVVYGPPSSYADDLLATFRKRKELFEYFNLGIPAIGVESEDVLRTTCRDVIHNTYERDYMVCIMFDSEVSTRFPSVGYTLHFFAGGLPQVKVKRPSEFAPPEPLSLEKLISKALMWTDAQHLTLVDRNTSEKKPWHTVYMRQFPHPSLPLDIRGYREKILLLVALSFSVPFCLRIAAIVGENASGIKEMLRLMGLREMAYWLGHYVTGVLTGILSSCIVIACMLVIEHDGGAYYLPQQTDVTLLGFTFFVFCCHYNMHAMLLASFFKDASIGVTFAVLYWFPITLFVPWQIIEGYESPLGTYIYAERHLKLLASTTPCLGTYFVLKIIGLSADFHGAATWSLVNKKVLQMDNVSIIEVWFVMVGTWAFIGMFLWYFTKVVPWTTGTPQPFYFPVTRQFWYPVVAVPTFPPLPPDLQDEQQPFETESSDGTPVIVVDSLWKSFDSAFVLKNVSLKIYDGQITTLLGHNGAGKTTLMNVITGMFLPDSGRVTVNGVNVANDTKRARKNMTFCQQHDVFFDDLTVFEHLIFYGSLKGLKTSYIRKRTRRILEVVRLLEKRSNLCATLSGGMKKRLSVGIAIISSPKVVILDEPTAGMDPESRREIWDVLLEMRNTTTIVLSTHDMEEVDVLADRIAILRDGHVQCCGSPAFLKKAFGTGYRVTISKKEGVFDIGLVLQRIKQFIPTARIAQDKLNEVQIDLCVNDTRGFGYMFQNLEGDCELLGIQAIGVKIATIESVYIKVNEDSNLHDGMEGNTAASTTDLRIVSTTPQKEPATVRRLSALLKKRRLYFTRVWITPVLCWLLPNLIFVAEFRLENNLLAKRNSITAHFDFVSPAIQTESLELESRQLYPFGPTFVDFDNASSEFVSKHYRTVAEDSVDSLVTLKNAEEELLSIGSKNFLEYTRSYIFGSVFRLDPDDDTLRLEVWWNPHAVLSSVIALNLMNTAVLRYVTGDAKATIAAKIKLHKEENAAVNPTYDFSKTALRDMLKVVLLMFTRSVFVPLATAFIVATFSIFPVIERTTQVKALQLMTGLSSLLFWTSNLVFDLLIYLIAWTVTGFLLNLEYPLRADTNAALLVLIMAFSVLGISTSYFVTSFAKTTAGAFTFVLLLFFFGGATPIFVYLVIMMLRANSGLKHPRWVPLMLMPLPSFTFPWSIIKALQLDSENEQCLRYSQTKQGVFYELDLFCLTLSNSSRYPGGMFTCCAHYTSNVTTGIKTLSPFSFHEAGIALELLVMAAEGIFLFGLVVWKDSGSRVPTLRSSQRVRTLYPWLDKNLDADVQEEKILVDQLRLMDAPLKYAMVVDDVHKKYGTLHAVRGLSVAIRPQECLGLLGINGAGKTTTFRMLAALEPMTDGDAYTRDVVLSKQRRQWQSNIGYCPQSDGLLGKLNAFELLSLFANLRGISETKVFSLVESVVKIVGLSAQSTKWCESYSGGNKRKLSIAIALVGVPRLVFLDEPSAGVDVVARKRIFRAVDVIKETSGMSIVLTSHSLAECEGACDRIGIMVNGQFQCLGPLPHIKQRFGKGYVMCVKSAAVDDVRNGTIQTAIQRIFPDAKLKQCHGGLLEYHLENRQMWSQVFAKMDILKESSVIEHLLISDTSLEQIFMVMANIHHPSTGPPQH